MARPIRNEVAQQQFADCLRNLAATKPELRVKDIERWGWEHLNAEVAVTSIRSALDGKVDPTACGLELLMVLSGFFEVSPAELGTYAERRLNAALAYGSNGGPNGGPGLGSDAFGWFGQTAQGDPEPVTVSCLRLADAA